MGRASDAPVVASAGTQAEPRTPASWLLFADRSQTAAPLPVGSDPRSVRRTEPFHKAPLPSSPALGRYAKGLPCCRNFTPAQPDRPAASMRDFCSGAYRNGARVEPVRHRQTKGAATDMFGLQPPRHISTLPGSVDGCAKILQTVWKHPVVARPAAVSIRLDVLSEFLSRGIRFVKTGPSPWCSITSRN